MLIKYLVRSFTRCDKTRQDGASWGTQSASDISHVSQLTAHWLDCGSGPETGTLLNWVLEVEAHESERVVVEWSFCEGSHHQ